MDRKKMIQNPPEAIKQGNSEYHSKILDRPVEYWYEIFSNTELNVIKPDLHMWEITLKSDIIDEILENIRRMTQ
jgi:hypothetical protein